MSTTEQKVEYTWGLGRRKSATARVRIKPGTGTITINGKDIEQFFCCERDRNAVRMPLKVTSLLGKYDVFVNLDGGGTSGQSGAASLGVARALLTLDPTLKEVLRENGLLTRDSRIHERKKYGLRGARRAPQFSKR